MLNRMMSGFSLFKNSKKEVRTHGYERQGTARTEKESQAQLEGKAKIEKGEEEGKDVRETVNFIYVSDIAFPFDQYSLLQSEISSGVRAHSTVHIPFSSESRTQPPILN